MVTAKPDEREGALSLFVCLKKRREEEKVEPIKQEAVGVVFVAVGG